MLPPGSIVYTGIVLNSTNNQTEGVLPFDLEIPTPEIASSDPVTVSIPGGLDGATILLQNTAKNVAKYAPTPDGRTISEQVGLYGSLVYQTSGNQSIISVVLPPDVAQFITANSPIKSAASVMDALLFRVDQWNKEGFLVCSRLMRAMAKIMAGYRSAVATSRPQGQIIPTQRVQSLDLHTYLAHLKRLFMSVAVFFGSRANEAVGDRSPLVLDSAKQVIDGILNADQSGFVYDPNMSIVTGLSVPYAGMNYTPGDSVYIPGSGFVDEQLDAITRGILVSD